MVAKSEFFSWFLLKGNFNQIISIFFCNIPLVEGSFLLSRIRHNVSFKFPSFLLRLSPSTTAIVINANWMKCKFFYYFSIELLERQRTQWNIWWDRHFRSDEYGEFKEWKNVIFTQHCYVISVVIFIAWRFRCIIAYTFTGY